MTKKFVQLIPGSSLTETPWKNGGGSTKEIAIHPLKSSFEKSDFTWRLSTAEVKQPGNFSIFPDFERLLTIVKGEELVLEFADLRKSLKQGTVVKFHGEEEIACLLPQGPVTDLGLIFDPDQALTKMTLIELQGKPRSFSLSAPTVFFFCMEGEVASAVFPGELENTLNVGDTLRVYPREEERIVFLDPGPARCVLVAVEIADIAVASN